MGWIDAGPFYAINVVPGGVFERRPEGGESK
jgi:hypothetical protein